MLEESTLLFSFEPRDDTGHVLGWTGSQSVELPGRFVHDPPEKLFGGCPQVTTTDSHDERSASSVNASHGVRDPKHRPRKLRSRNLIPAQLGRQRTPLAVLRELCA